MIIQTTEYIIIMYLSIQVISLILFLIHKYSHLLFWSFVYILYIFAFCFVETKLSCSMCKKSFSHPKTLKLHMRLHNSSKGYECSICHKRFTSMFLLLTSKNLVLNVSFSECHIDVFCCRERKPQGSHENSQRIQDYTISGINKPIIQLFGIYCIWLLILQKIIPYPWMIESFWRSVHIK